LSDEGIAAPNAPSRSRFASRVGYGVVAKTAVAIRQKENNTLFMPNGSASVARNNLFVTLSFPRSRSNLETVGMFILGESGFDQTR
jgi:hypothetical protein